VQPDQFLNESQADSGTFIGVRMSSLDAMKALENALAVLFGNAGSCVADLQLSYSIG
jgi:hypothetical protein